MKTILLVEDNPNQAALYEEELQDEGYRVLHAATGYQALHLARDYYPDLVVLDINLPDMDGLSVLEHLLEEHPRLPVIIHTAYSSYQSNLMRLAAEAFVCKSSDLSVLKSHIRHALEKHALHTEPTIKVGANNKSRSGREYDCLAQTESCR